jgi:hypothetical protein
MARRGVSLAYLGVRIRRDLAEAWANLVNLHRVDCGNSEKMWPLQEK